MASSSVLTSPVAMTFEGAGGKLRFQAIVKIPKDCKLAVADIQSPLRATAAAFAPETITAPEFPPGLTPKKSAGTTNGAPEVSCDTSSVSPTLSVATTAKSSDVSATAVTWADEYALEEIIGRKTTNQLLNHLDPTLTTIPRGLLKTCAITNPRDRYRMHELIERIWGGRLIHQTSRKDSCMYIWVPGSKVPKWLQQLHMHRARNVRETSTAGKAAPNKTTTPAEAKSAPVKVERPVHAVWTNFAKDENTRYGKVAAMSAAECGNARSSQEAEQDGEKKADGQDRKYLFKETFKQTASAATNGALGESRTELGTETTRHTKDGSNTVVDNATESKNALPPHLRARTVSPPHLRAKSITVDNTAEVAESNTKEIDTTTNEGVWVAARLPTPYSPN